MPLSRKNRRECSIIRISSDFDYSHMLQNRRNWRKGRNPSEENSPAKRFSCAHERLHREKHVFVVKFFGGIRQNLAIPPITPMQPVCRFGGNAEKSAIPPKADAKIGTIVVAHVRCRRNRTIPLGFSYFFALRPIATCANWEILTKTACFLPISWSHQRTNERKQRQNAGNRRFL